MNGSGEFRQIVEPLSDRTFSVMVDISDSSRLAATPILIDARVEFENGGTDSVRMAFSLESAQALQHMLLNAINAVLQGPGGDS